MIRTPFQLQSPHRRDALAFMTAVERAGNLVVAARRALAATHGLTAPAWRLLAVISRSQHRTSFARIARLLRISRQAVREMASDLRERGLLTTPHGSSNRKELRLLLTPKAHLAMAYLDETLTFLLLELTNDLSREALVTAAQLLNGLSVRLRRCETILPASGSPRSCASRR